MIPMQYAFRRRMMQLLRIGDLPVGSFVVLPREESEELKWSVYTIVHQGKPSDDYDESCNGTWLLDPWLNTGGDWGFGSDYAAATAEYLVHITLSNWCSGFTSEVQSGIREVKIPYHVGKCSASACTHEIRYGSEGLTAKCFFLSSNEINSPIEGAANFGSVLDYFNVTGDTLKMRLKAYERNSSYAGGINFEEWLTRTPAGANSVVSVKPAGTVGTRSLGSADYLLNFRIATVFDPDFPVKKMETYDVLDHTRYFIETDGVGVYELDY